MISNLNEEKDLNEIIKDKINIMPSKENVEHAKINNSKNIGHCKYVDYIRVECKEKYNDIYKYLIDNNYVPEGYKSNEKKDNKKLSKKREICSEINVKKLFYR